MNIVIFAFNYLYAGNTINGPGICLYNFAKIFKEHNISIFTALQSKEKDIYNLKSSKIKYKIKDADIIILWSGISNQVIEHIKYANDLNKIVLLGPNLIDCVEFDKEKAFLAKIKYSKILTVNKYLKYKIGKEHNIEQDKIDLLLIGPDLELWKPIKEKDNSILWKGNYKHFVKDISFALEIKNRLKKYNFKFIGYPNSYEYFSHIEDAKRSKIYFSTSLSETMGMTLLESWCSGLPSVTHPKIFMHGENYSTGIITNRTVDDYCVAIEEIMQNDRLYKDISESAYQYMHDNFSDKIVKKKFEDIIRQK